MSKITVIPNPKQETTKRYDELKPGHYYRCVKAPKFSEGFYVNKIGKAIDLITKSNDINATRWYLVWSSGTGYFGNLTSEYQTFRFVEIDVEIKEV